jgi:hypothetical protein
LLVGVEGVGIRVVIPQHLPTPQHQAPLTAITEAETILVLVEAVVLVEVGEHTLQVEVD